MCFAAREHWTSSSSSSRVFELRLSAGHTQIRHWTNPSFGGYGVKVKAKVIVMPKAAVLDPQGNAVRDAMQHLGMPEVRSVRIGKYMEIDIDGQNGDLETRLRGLCRDLLSNPVIEDYELQKVDVGDRKKTPNAQPKKPRATKSK